MMKEYESIGVYIIRTGVITVGVLGLSYVLSPHRRDAEKVSPYECGFSPFEDAQHQFDVRFYLVAIRFRIFDLEVSYLYPWAITVGTIDSIGYWTMMGFIGILTVGFVYEWLKGALEWE